MFFIYFTGKKQFGVEELGRNIEKQLKFARQLFATQKYSFKWRQNSNDQVEE